MQKPAGPDSVSRCCATDNVNELTKLAVQSEEDGARPLGNERIGRKGLSEKRDIRQNDASIGRG